MLTDDAKDQLVEVISVAGECVRQGATLPSLILIYSALDALGWLVDPEAHPSARLVFTAWVERWLLASRPLPCTAAELYAARCGVLHTFTAASVDATKGKVRRIAYSWGGASATELQSRLELEAPGSSVAVDIDDLYDGLRLGAAQCFEDALTDDMLSTTIERKARLYFTAIWVERPS